MKSTQKPDEPQFSILPLPAGDYDSASISCMIIVPDDAPPVKQEFRELSLGLSSGIEPTGPEITECLPAS